MTRTFHQDSIFRLPYFMAAMRRMTGLARRHKRKRLEHMVSLVASGEH